MSCSKNTFLILIIIVCTLFSEGFITGEIKGMISEMNEISEISKYYDEDDHGVRTTHLRICYSNSEMTIETLKNELLVLSKISDKITCPEDNAILKEKIKEAISRVLKDDILINRKHFINYKTYDLPEVSMELNELVIWKFDQVVDALKRVEESLIQ